MIFCYTRSLNSLGIHTVNLTCTFTCFYQSHLIIGCAQLSGETRSLATFRMHWQEPRKEKRRQSESRDFSDHFRIEKYMGTIIECEGWRQHSSLIFLILLFTKPNIEVSGWLFQTKTHFTHIVYQPFSRVLPPSFTLYGLTPHVSSVLLGLMPMVIKKHSKGQKHLFEF